MEPPGWIKSLYTHHHLHSMKKASGSFHSLCLAKNIVRLRARCCEPGAARTGDKNNRCDTRLRKTHVRLNFGVAPAGGSWPSCGREGVGLDVLEAAIAG